MRALWPPVAIVVVLIGLATGGAFLYLLGSIVGTVLESIVRATPTFLYELPAHFNTAYRWLCSALWSAVANPLHTICLVLGMLLVLTYFRAMLGHFSSEPPVFRGSAVRTADDVFPDLDDLSGQTSSTLFQGSSLADGDTTYSPLEESVISRLWQSIKRLLTRTSAGDDLL